MDVTVGLDVVIRVNHDNLVSALSETDPPGFSGNQDDQDVLIRLLILNYKFLLLHKLQTEFGNEDLFSHSVNFMQQKVE